MCVPESLRVPLQGVIVYNSRCVGCPRRFVILPVFRSCVDCGGIVLCAFHSLELPFTAKVWSQWWSSATVLCPQYCSLERVKPSCVTFTLPPHMFTWITLRSPFSDNWEVCSWDGTFVVHLLYIFWRRCTKGEDGDGGLGCIYFMYQSCWKIQAILCQRKLLFWKLLEKRVNQKWHTNISHTHSSLGLLWANTKMVLTTLKWYLVFDDI